MHVRYDLEGVRDHEELLVTVEGGVKEPHFVTATLIGFMVNVGIKEVTDKSAPELLYRINEVEDVDGAYMGTPDGPKFMTAKDIERHMGLKVYVTPKSDTKFAADMNRRRKEQAARKRRAAVSEFARLRKVVTA